MAINKLITGTTMPMLKSGFTYLDKRMSKDISTNFTNAKKKHKRKAERAARRKNRK